MSFKSVSNGLVPCRFLCMVAHLVVVICLFIRKSDYVNACNTQDYGQPNVLDTQFTVALSVSLGLFFFEFGSFMMGITLFNSFQLLVSALLHSAAGMALSCMLIYEWCSVSYWPVFAICSCVPTITEFIFLIGVWFFKRTVS